MSEFIKFENVKKIYSDGRYAVKDVSFVIHEKEYVLFHGAPESGMSALIRLFSGLDAPTDGKIFINDRALHEVSRDEAADFRNLNFGIVQETPCFLEHINLLENVALPLTVRGVSAHKRIKAAKQQLKDLGILYATRAYPKQITTYEAQIASIARALVARPKILLLEDITAGFSERESRQILDIIEDVRKHGECVIIHFSGTKSGLLSADRYFTLDHGMIGEDMS